MKLSNKQKEQQVCIVLRRMRESNQITMRQAGAMIGVSHSAISQFENGKLRLPDFRIEQLVNAYGYTKEDFDKIIGRAPILDPAVECRKMIDQLEPDFAMLIYKVMIQFVRVHKLEMYNNGLTSSGNL